MENKEQDSNPFGQLEIDDDFFDALTSEVELEDDQDEKDEKEDIKAEEPTSEEEDGDEPEDKEEQEEEKKDSVEEEEDLSDEKIYEVYGEDANPAIVRHYDIIKDYLILDEETKFDGKNLEALYEADIKNRNNILAQKLLERLPPSYRTILDKAVTAEEPLSAETYDYLLRAGNEQLKNTYDEDDEDSIKDYVKAALIESGTDAADVNDIVEVYSDKGKLEEIAAKYKEKKDSFLEEQKALKVQEDQEIARSKRAQQQEFKAKIDNTIDSAGYKNVRKATIKKYIFGQTKTGDTPMVESLKSIYSNPEALITLADMLSYYDTSTGNWDMSKFEKKEMTKQAKKVKNSIEAKISGSNAFKTPGSRKSKVDFDWEEVGV